MKKVLYISLLSICTLTACSSGPKVSNAAKAQQNVLNAQTASTPVPNFNPCAGLVKNRKTTFSASVFSTNNQYQVNTATQTSGSC
jgi:hypothetical protein